MEGSFGKEERNSDRVGLRPSFNDSWIERILQDVCVDGRDVTQDLFIYALVLNKTILTDRLSIFLLRLINKITLVKNG